MPFPGRKYPLHTRFVELLFLLFWQHLLLFISYEFSFLMQIQKSVYSCSKNKQGQSLAKLKFSLVKEF